MQEKKTKHNKKKENERKRENVHVIKFADW